MISNRPLGPDEDVLNHALGQADSWDGRWADLMATDWFKLVPSHDCEAPSDHLAEALTQGILPASAVTDEMSTYQLREFVLHCHHEAVGGDIEPGDWERWGDEAQSGLHSRLAELMFSGADFQAGCRLAKEWGSYHRRGLGWVGAKRRWRKGSAYPASLGIHGLDEVVDWLGEGRHPAARHVNACAALGVELPSLRAYARLRMAQLAGQADEASPARRVLDARRRRLPDVGEAGRTFGGRFDVFGDELGEGGYGRVFVAKDLWRDRFSSVPEAVPRETRFCAIKLTPSSDASRVSALWDEADALRRAPRLHSIPAFVGLAEGSFDGAPHLGLAEEWVRGPTLASLLKAVRARRWVGRNSVKARGWIPLRWIDRWMFDLREALAWLHEAGFMHGDVKPENVVIDPNTLRAVLVDWGAFRRAGTVGPYTPGYVHPTGRDSKRQDDYQLALVFSRLMAARPGSSIVGFMTGRGSEARGRHRLAMSAEGLKRARQRASRAPSPWAGMFAPELADRHGEPPPAHRLSVPPAEAPPEWRLPYVALGFSEPDSRSRVRRRRDDGHRRWHQQLGQRR